MFQGRTKAEPWIVEVGPHLEMCPHSSSIACLCSVLVPARRAYWRDGYRAILAGAMARGLMPAEVLVHPLMVPVLICAERAQWEANRR